MRKNFLMKDDSGSLSFFVGGIATGAGIMYLADPAGGRRRRGIVRQKAMHAAHGTAEAAEITARDLQNRGRGIFAAIAGRLRLGQTDDEVLVARVRAKLGRVCSHPHAIQVMLKGPGVVELKGPILRSELNRVLTKIAAVKGVIDIDNDLVTHETAEHIPALQGGAENQRDLPELFQSNWSPSGRLVAGATGVYLMLRGLRRRDLVGYGSVATGVALLARSITNLEMRRLIGAGAGTRAVDVSKTINVEAPVEQVFMFFSAFQNFPRFMRHVKNVQPIGDGRWHWMVEGPAAIPVEWDAVVTDFEPRRIIAWQSVEGAAVKSAGVVRFDDQGGRTRIQVQMSYNPPAGAIGHALAKLLGADPKRQMDDDLLRFKSLIETGKATGREGQVSRDELQGGAPIH
jgi:uncharacterized membrane protein